MWSPDQVPAASFRTALRQTKRIKNRPHPRKPVSRHHHIFASAFAVLPLSSCRQQYLSFLTSVNPNGRLHLPMHAIPSAGVPVPSRPPAPHRCRAAGERARPPEGPVFNDNFPAFFRVARLIAEINGVSFSVLRSQNIVICNGRPAALEPFIIKGWYGTPLALPTWCGYPDALPLLQALPLPARVLLWRRSSTRFPAHRAPHQWR